MKSIRKIVIATISVLSLTLGNAQIKNAKTENLKIYGNCDQCKTDIEKTGNLKNISPIDFDQKTEIAVVTYDITKTDADDILKRIALVGYDNEKYYAPDETYAKLGECCQYKRPKPDTRVSETMVSSNERSHQNGHGASWGYGNGEYFVHNAITRFRSA